MKSKKAFEGNLLSIILVAVTVLIVIGAFVFAIAKLGKQAADIGMPGEEGETCSQKGGACYDGSTCPQGKTKESGQCAQGKVCCS